MDALRIPKYGLEAMEIPRVGFTIDVWSLAVDAKVSLGKALVQTDGQLCPQERRLCQCFPYTGSAQLFQGLLAPRGVYKWILRTFMKN
jgi:hypothetical protein